ncbi:MAG: hypothetical protein IJI98_11115 [Methanosphaera sp.]|nr:hypothetical protein [Methanobrevibacter sp.]MBQ6754212.1 hypothetical protein [Bacteroidales bacterium]MBR0351345.1 hypothetical protein [Clostridia bacterium]MBR0473229.1 hypothetical protein [Methanosphaera sp.]
MNDLLFEYKVRTKHRLGFKEFSFYATTDIEEFLNRNNIEYVRNATDTVESRLFKEIERLNNIINEIEAIIYNNQITGIEARLEIQERLDKLQELKGVDKE